MENRKRKTSEFKEDPIKSLRLQSTLIPTYKLDSIQFFDVSCYNLAHFLLGKILVRKIDDTILKGRIVETECYLGGEDKASHSYNGRKTPRTEPMYMQAGTTYVYMTYGIYYCFNISSKEPGAVVLLRALDPLEGLYKMRELRSLKQKQVKEIKDRDLCNGPSKLCISMNIEKSNCNMLDLCNNDMLWLESGHNDEDFKTVTSQRIGIDSCGEEWAKKPLRFYIYENKSVSKRDRRAEQSLL